MKIERRQFIQVMGSMAPGLVTIKYALINHHVKSLKVLVLGGTNFLGPAVVQALIKANCQITLFNRGVTNPHLFPDLVKIKGDRRQGLEGYRDLKAGQDKWDCVIDVWPENPQFVEEAIKVVGDRTNHFIFVSSIAVYNDFGKVGMDEDAALRNGTEFEPGNYNLNKVLCEKVVEKHFPDKFTIVRPGAIVGDRDPGLFGTYVLNRIFNRARILAPDSNDPVQFIDVKDVAGFLSSCATKQTPGHFNLVGPGNKMGYKEMIVRIKEVLKSQVEIHWMDPDFLIKEVKLEPFLEIPFWIPIAHDPEPGFYQIDHAKAMASGLQFTSFESTVKQSLDSFLNGRFITEGEDAFTFGISGEREDAIIERWERRKG